MNHKDEYAAVHTSNDGRAHPRSISLAMNELRKRHVRCARAGCVLRASHIAADDQPVCEFCYRVEKTPRLTLAAAWARQRAAMSR
jgi:hypothetical protein